MSNAEVIQADLTWTGERFEPLLQVEVKPEGRIARVGRLGLEPTQTLRGQALLPGMVNAHSHGFQRGLRGLTESFPRGQGSFWGWRDAMYRLVGSLDRKSFYELSLLAFQEMRAAGITAVGEFHYLHEFDDALLEAARDAGIRIVLLSVFYRTGGIGQPLSGAQLRFATPSVAHYWKHFDALAARVGATESVGIAPHSIRGASPDEIAALHEEARRRGAVFHMHVEEQRREVEQSIAAYQHPPMQILLDRLEIGSEFTAVHCTHTDARELDEFLSRGGRVCLAPLTEANLGDGIPSREPLRRLPRQLSLGTDCNARISMLEEMRWLEYAHRLASESRGVFQDETGSVTHTLFHTATAGGAQSLGLDVGEIRPGAWADFATVDLSSSQLSGWTPETLLDTLIFGAGEEVILATCVAGRWTTHRQSQG
jgi:formimidoylglutamate deiminase